jgi:predicted protein tyrosine phosphatase
MAEASRKAALCSRFLALAATTAESVRARDQIRTMSHSGHPIGTDARLHVLFVCSRNQWRSPTAEQVWRRHPQVDARSAGTSAGARHVVSAVDLAWADVVLVMEDKHKARLLADHRALLASRRLHVLDIPDDYTYMDPELVDLLGDPVAELLGLLR